MKQLKKHINKTIARMIDKISGPGLMQEENEAGGKKLTDDGMAKLARLAAAEGCVLLKNNGVLPLGKGESTAVFGRCQCDSFYVGYGSGGDVHAPYYVNILDALEQRGDIDIDRVLAERYRSWCADEENTPDHGWWGHWPLCYDEMPLSEEDIRLAADRSRTALLVIGRASGEDRENLLKKGSYYLTDDEVRLLELVTKYFGRVAVLFNCGTIIDMSAVAALGDRVGAIMYLWLGGMEFGNAVADVLCGDVNACGKLACTVAKEYADYPCADNFGGKNFNNYAEDIYVGYRYFDTFKPERVLYPFGFGLSYTDFEIRTGALRREKEHFSLSAAVKNTGMRPGKETVQLYIEAPVGLLGKARRSLVAFKKTALLAPGESEELTLDFCEYDIASFDDGGKTGYRSCYVLEEGEYRLFIGDSCAGCFALDKTKCVKRLGEICCIPESDAFLRLCVNKDKTPAFEKTPVGSRCLKQRIADALLPEPPYTGFVGYTLKDVKQGRVSLRDFVAQLDTCELEALTRGEGMMNSSLGAPGNSGVFGGVLPSLREKGIPPVTTADGPSGLRLRRYCSLLPCGTALACTRNEKLIEQLLERIAAEMELGGVDVILAPGMNIQRGPLCGRNFEYFSEDPLVSGRIAAAFVRGAQSAGRSACPKHFACNNQELNRSRCDSRVSERALREIYLKGFEICVKTAEPRCIMTSYNKINGVWSHYNYDLVKTVLYGEWGYKGLVMTDWWMRSARSPEFPALRDNAYRVRAGVCLLMPGSKNHTAKKYRSDGTLLRTLGRANGITRAELCAVAENTLRLCLEKI